MFQNTLVQCASLSKSVCRAALSATLAFFVCLAAGLPINAVTDAVRGSESALPSIDDSQKRMEAVENQIENSKTDSPLLQNQYSLLSSVINDCALARVLTEPAVREILSPAASLCINGALSNPSDPTFNRVMASSTGTGVGNGTVGNCSLSGTVTATRYDAYNFNLTGCAAFPTEVTATLCGPAGCQHLGNVDTMLTLYRNVPAGDPLTANGGLPGVFNSADACTNARGAQDDLGTTVGTTNNPGGATCNQTVAANCVAPCTSPSNAGGLSGFRRQLGNGRFTIVVAGFSNATVGNYNLYIDAPAAGCLVALAPTAASISIAGRVITPQELGLTNALVTLTDSQGNSRTVLTRKLGSFRFADVTAGETYIVSVSSKRYTFAPQVITATEDLADLVFIPLQ